MSTRRLRAAQETAVALWLLGRTTVLFRIRGQRAVAHDTERALMVEPASREQLRASGANLRRIFRACQRAKRLWPLEVRCLQTALVQQAMLARHGVSGAIRVGVEEQNDRVYAHAWLEVAGYALDGGTDAESAAMLPRRMLSRAADEDRPA